MPLYKIGEEVTIVPRNKHKHYRCGYVEGMVDLAGRKGHVVHTFDLESSHSDDFHLL